VGVNLKVFFVDAGQVTPVPLSDFERLRSGDPAVSFPQHSGKRVRCALAVVESQDRRPVAVAHVDYVFLPFGPDGRLKMRELRRAKWLAVNEVSVTFGAVSEPALEMSPYITRGRYRQEFVWVPTEAEVAAVMKMALNTGA
jgi:hypothetical protein